MKAAPRSLMLLTAGFMAVSLSACGSTTASNEGGGSVLRNLLLYGGPTVPPPAPDQVEEIDCPQVTISDGGAAIRSYAGGKVGDGQALRHQIAINQTARECTPTGGGGYKLKVGVEARAIIGASGAAGRYEAPVRITVKRGDTIIANRITRGAATIPAGQTNGDFVVVEDNIQVPPGRGEVEIEVGLDTRAPAAARKRKSR